MKAKDLEKQLKEFYTTNKDGKGSGFGKRLIESYARIQIEKDRVSESELMITVRADAQDYDPSERVCFLEGAETVLRQLRNRPIILD